MRGLWMHAGQVRLRDDLPRPQPGAGEVLIRVRRAGICNTDLEIMRGYAPFDGILGHEFVGEVLGGKDHSTVLYAQKRFEQLMETDSTTRHHLAAVRDIIIRSRRVSVSAD